MSEDKVPGDYSSITAPYGTWESPLDVLALFEKPAAPTFPSCQDGIVYWVQSLPAEGGRAVLMRLGEDGVEQRLTPEGFSIRSRVHEYGGRCHLVASDCCYFVNDSDQRIYRQKFMAADAPEVLSGIIEDGQSRFADLSIDPVGDFLLCVMEVDYADRENRNAVAVLPLDGSFPAMPVTIAEGCDFYANPVIDSAGRQVAWLQWNNPCMPWDQCEAVLGELRRESMGIVIVNARVVAGGQNASVCQLSFDDSDRLILAMDQSVTPDCSHHNFWNLYSYSGDRLQAITADQDGEYGYPHWIFGDRRYVALGETILAVKSGRDGEALVTVKDGVVQSVRPEANSVSQLSPCEDGDVLFVEAGASFSSRLSRWRNGKISAVKSAPEILPLESVSTPQSISFPTTSGDTAFGFFYPPKNARYRPDAETLPPLLVLVHGGPTARSLPSLDLSRQYWTSLGFAVLDVNHRGSTGYGRAYRQSLLNHWGCHDSDDVICGIKYVVERGWARRDQVFIRGKSAGGYAVLCALTRYPEQFAAGACYYGIGNLATLADHTHKFERYYTDQLIGEEFDRDAARRERSLYYRRSPINYMSAIGCPLIVFQGLEDKVVPPSVSKEIIRALSSLGLDFEYVEYPGEGHGFRRSETNIDALSRETAFYQKILAGGRKTELAK